ncbi:hypothetical protein C9374_012489 [Naegleria lovaniensis]|uniref:Uncharacterized protein n=1 Tax=Naegleria lovaniensis TaxID=51637 RepID=A0AA88H333_NAELO|nr:uncharacterized protein C9374_012489 [Naegleria lovaniensis]KAG2392237.1 hypothetical protein C9374_012489 [Naegleria lovaniensis]
MSASNLSITILMMMMSTLLLLSFTNAFQVNTSLYNKLISSTCKRKIEVNRSDSGKLIRFVTKAGCIDRRNNTAIGAVSEIEFFASIAKFPMVGMKGKTIVKVNLPGSNNDKEFAIHVGSSFGLDEILEYREKNGVEGFQPGNDTVLRSFRLGQYAWTVDSLTRTPLNDANTSYVYQAVVSTTIPNFCTLKLGAMVTSDVITFTSPKLVNRTGVVQVLNPSSFKLTLEVNDINYEASDSLIALGSVIAFRGTRRDKPKSSTPTQRSIFGGEEAEKPDDSSDDQQVSQFDDDVSSQLGGNLASLPKTFFSFQNFISRWNTSAPTVITRGKFVSTKYMPFQPAQDGESTLRDFVDSNAALARFYMSITERVNNFVWDPSVGSSEESSNLINSAARNNGMMMVMIMVLLALFAFLL